MGVGIALLNTSSRVFRTQRRPRDAFSIKGILFFHTTAPERTGASLPWPRGRAWCWACSPLWPRAGSRRGLRAWTPPPPPARSQLHQGVFVSIETGLQEAVGHGPQPRCCRVGQLLVGCCLGRSGDSTTSTGFFHLLFSLLKGTPWLLKHSVGIFW